MGTPATVPMFAPDGTLGDIPYEHMHDAIAAGAKMGVYVKAPDGSDGVVPADKVQDAVKAGGKVVPYNLDVNHQKEGFWSAFGNTLKNIPAGMAHAIATGGEMANPSQPVGAENTLPEQAIASARAADAQRQAEGRSVPYRAAAPLAEAVGADVSGMEEAARKGDVAGVAGHAAGSAAPVVAGAAIGELAPKVGPVAERVARNQAEGFYQSALKPSTRLSPTKVAAAVDTGISAGIPVTESGVAKLTELIADANAKIKAVIDTDPTRPISKFKVADRLHDTADTFKNQVSPTADLQTITDVGKDFVKTQPNQIPAADAQALKQGTYKQLSDKAYGELKSASIEAQKALARGLKEELAGAFPELKQLNAEASAFYNLDPLLEKAVQRITNHQLIGIGTPAAMAGTEALTGSRAATGVMGVLKAVVDNPSVKSRLAIMLGKASNGKITPAMAVSRIAAYSAALGAHAQDDVAASAEVRDDHTN